MINLTRTHLKDTPELLLSWEKRFKMGMTKSLGRRQALTKSPGRKGLYYDALGFWFCQRPPMSELYNNKNSEKVLSFSNRSSIQSVGKIMF